MYFQWVNDDKDALVLITKRLCDDAINILLQTILVILYFLGESQKDIWN
jgi:hypothetical protein